jgi:hypothetical protein
VEKRKTSPSPLVERFDLVHRGPPVVRRRYCPRMVRSKRPTEQARERVSPERGIHLVHVVRFNGTLLQLGDRPPMPMTGLGQLHRRSQGDAARAVACPSRGRTSRSHVGVSTCPTPSVKTTPGAQPRGDSACAGGHSLRGRGTAGIQGPQADSEGCVMGDSSPGPQRRAYVSTEGES